MFKKILFFVLVLLLLCSRADAASEINMVSDKMRYDIEGGRFVAEGNVTIRGRGLVLTAERGEGFIDKRTFNITGNILVSGDWNGERVNLSSQTASASMNEPAVYTLESGIRGSIGKMAIDDCSYLQMSGDDIIVKDIRNLKNTETGMTFSAKNAKAKILNGEFVQVEADGDIVFVGTPGKAGDVVRIRGQKAVYSVERGTVVISGGVTAVQNKRTLRAASVIYFPKTNRIEAVGKPHITINVDDEGLKK